MESGQLLLIALVQGLTEFLPISSSAHLILFAEAFGFGEQGLSFDVAVHFGTLGALCWYLRDDLRLLPSPFAADQRQRDSARRLWLLLLLGTLPLAVVGLALRDLVEEYLRQVAVIASANLFFAALLWRAWHKGSGQLASTLQLSRRQLLLVGCTQAFAVIPGASRTGMAMTGALIVGLQPAQAIRLSFLLGVPALAGAFALELVRWSEVARVEWTQALAGALVAGLVALVVLRGLTSWVRRIGMLPFVFYRLLLGAVLLVFFVQPLS